MEVDFLQLMRRVIEVFRYGAFIGFLVATTLFMNINNKAFHSVFREKSKQYFWFFMVLSIIPLLVFIFIFNLLFGRLTMAYNN